MLHTLINRNNVGDFSMIRCLAYAFTAIFKSRARLVTENLCLRQQLIVLKRRQARPQLRDADRRFWVLACQLFSGWSRIPLVAGIVRAGKPTGAGDHAVRAERDAGRSSPNSVNSFAVWLARIPCGKREACPWGTTQNPGRIGTSWLLGLCAYCRQIHAPYLQWNALPRLAAIPDSA